jgi:hypothetical protein
MARWRQQMRFSTTTENPGPLNLHELAERHANELWVPAELDERQAVQFALDQFRRQVAAELEMIEMRASHLMERKIAG